MNLSKANCTGASYSPFRHLDSQFQKCPCIGNSVRLVYLLADADMAQLVEHHLAKVGVAGSNPVVRSRMLKAGQFKAWPAFFNIWRRGQVVRQRPAKPSPPVRIRASPPESQTPLRGVFHCAWFIIPSVKKCFCKELQCRKTAWPYSSMWETRC